MLCIPVSMMADNRNANVRFKWKQKQKLIYWMNILWCGCWHWREVKCGRSACDDALLGSSDVFGDRTAYFVVWIVVVSDDAIESIPLPTFSMNHVDKANDVFFFLFFSTLLHSSIVCEEQTFNIRYSTFMQSSIDCVLLRRAAAKSTINDVNKSLVLWSETAKACSAVR